MKDFGVSELTSVLISQKLDTCNWLYVIYVPPRHHHSSQTCTVKCGGHLVSVVQLSVTRSILLFTHYSMLQWNNSCSWLPSWFMSCMLAAPLLTNFSLSACHWLKCLSTIVFSECSCFLLSVYDFVFLTVWMRESWVCVSQCYSWRLWSIMEFRNVCCRCERF